MNYTNGFFSWGTWLEQLREPHLWTQQSQGTPPPWRALVDSLRNEIAGIAAVHRAKSELVTAIITLVYRKGEQERLKSDNQKHASERDVMRRVRAVVTRQRRHDAQGLTLIRYLDLAFVFSAYKDCRLAIAARHAHHDMDQIRLQVDNELLFFDSKPTAQHIRAVTERMHSYMWNKRWLPWYEHIPGVRDEMILRAREAALAFCQGMPSPELRLREGVRGLSRDHIAGTSSMNDWLFTLFDRSYAPKWERLVDVYTTAVADDRGEEDALLEETSRRVVETILSPLTEHKEGMDFAHSRLIDATPSIVVTQSVRVPGRFTFRQLLDLHIHVTTFTRFLHSSFHGTSLPTFADIHSGVLQFEQVRCRMLGLRLTIDSEKADEFYDWVLSIPDSHPPNTHATAVAHSSCVNYQKAAIKAALGSACMSFARPLKEPAPEPDIPDNDPLMYAAVIAQWDTKLAASIVDAAVRIDRKERERFRSGNGNGLDLYTHRRILVCDAAREAYNGDVKAAARIMARLHPVWDECEADKCIGEFDERGALSLKSSVDRGNFEAAATFGILLCSDDWEERRKGCHIPRDLEAGIVFMSRAVSMGDTAAAADLVHILRAFSTENSQGGKIPTRVGDYVIECLQIAAREEPSMGLFLGYLYSLGAAGIPVDCDAAIKSYQMVLQCKTSTMAYQACAANNIGALKALNFGTESENGKGEEDKQTQDYLKAAAIAGNKKAESNLAAIVAQGCDKNERDLRLATDLYGQCFQSSDGKSPVTVIQKDTSGNQMTIFEMLVESERQELFCKELRAEGMAVERYGKVLVRETLPCSTPMQRQKE